MKYYRCTRDLLHYRFNGNIYNFKMGQIVPYTRIVQDNLLNFEFFGDHNEKEINEEPVTQLEKVIKPKKTKEKPLEVEIIAETEEKEKPKKRRGRPKKVKTNDK